MSEPWIECVPNFSEGRRPEVIDSIRAAIAAVSGAHVLDQHVDADHNRSVITFAGPPGPVAEAAFAAIARAAKLIDLDRHRGEHPRIGATDVVPFVPLEGATLEACVEIARALGQRVGETLGIPVYLYEAAATRPERVNLENLRRGEYEGLKAAIADDPARAPDFGPARLGKAGATVIGARQPLIAFNAYLTTGEVEIARRIARAIRHSSGGLRYLKALGLLVEGTAQVSMNLTDYRLTPLARVVELIRREAARHGVALRETELVGLIPQAALVEAARWYMQLDRFEPDQILESRLYAAARTAEAPLLERLAAATPTPGGGSAAAHAGAMGAALVGMVARLTHGKKAYAAVESRMGEIATQADGLRTSLGAAVARDAAAFESVMAALRLPKGTPQEAEARQAAVEQATRGAGEVPLEVASQAVTVIELAAEAVETGAKQAATDAASGAMLALAASRAAAMNVRVNAQSLQDGQVGEAWEAALRALEARAPAAEARVRAALQARAGVQV